MVVACVCDVAMWTCDGVHGGSDLAGHHGSGEQLVQLDQLVGCRVKLECDAVQRVPRFHLDHKRRGKREKSQCEEKTGGCGGTEPSAPLSCSGGEKKIFVIATTFTRKGRELPWKSVKLHSSSRFG